MTEYQGYKFLEYLQKRIKSDKEDVSKPKESKLNMNKVIDMLGVSKTAVYSYFKSQNLERETVHKIVDTFKTTEREIWGTTELPIRNPVHIKAAIVGEDMRIEANSILKEANAKYIGELYDEDGNTKFIEISPGRYRMKVDLVPNYAKAGYLAGFEDPTYTEELPKHELTVTKHHRGKYLAFEVSGDSMYDGSIESVPDGCTITAREIKMDLWKSRLHTHAYPNWVFVHKTEGILVKRIKSQNMETGEIILESLNPDKESYPDKSVFLDDIYKIFNVVKRELN